MTTNTGRGRSASENQLDDNRWRRTIGFRDYGEDYRPSPRWQIITALIALVFCVGALITIQVR